MKILLRIRICRPPPASPVLVLRVPALAYIRGHIQRIFMNHPG